MANYKIDESTRIITGKASKLSSKEMEEVQFLCSLGYTFKNQKPRKGEKRSRDYYHGLLIAEDREIFEGLAAKKYSDAVSFASRIIKLGKYADGKSDGTALVEEFRKLAKEDFSKAKLFSNEYLSLIADTKKAA